MDKFLNKITALGLTLEVQGDDLLLKGTKGKLSSDEVELIKSNTEVITFIKENKGQIIKYLNSLNDSGFKIKKEDVSALYELSPLQEGILFHGLYNSKSTAYKTQFSMEFSEGLDLDAFQKAWEYVIKNHTILRTSFIHDQLNIPVQCVYKKTKFNYELIDFTHFAKDELETQFIKLLTDERTKEFDFKKAPLMRVTLVQVDSKAIRMIWTKHHILWDGWSGQILMKEFIQAYAIYTQHGIPPVREEDKFEDYIKFIKNINTDEEKSFWKNYLEGFTEPSLLPFVNHQLENSTKSGDYKDVYLNFDQAFTEKITAYTKTANITVSTLLQGVWSLLLARYTSTNDIVFGVTVSGRPPETKYENKVGLYINTIPFRAVIDNTENVIQWLQTLQDKHVKAREFQYTSLSSIKKYTNIQNDFFDSIFVFRNFPVNKYKEKGAGNSLEIKNYNVQENNNYPLSVQADLHEVLCVDFKFNSDIINEEYMQMISSHFEYSLNQIITNPDIKLDSINLISDSERHTILNEFNDTQVSYAETGNSTILDLIDKQAQKAPDEIAVEFENVSLTYQELREKSNQLANHLLNRGIKKGDLIGICLERSLEMIIGILGILKAGAAYVPIDPEYPEERINYVLEEINAQTIISTQKSSAGLSHKNTDKYLNIDDWSLIGQESVICPKIEIQSSDIMYVIYTSGSTGKPKGVMNQYDGLLNRLLWAQDSYALDRTDVVLQKTTFCFDVSVWELFLPLITGAKLLFAKPEGHKDNVYLKNIIEEKKVTILHFVPSMLSVFLPELSPNDCATIKTIVCSGEALQMSHINEFKNIFGNRNVRLQNLYGPTEAAIDVTFWDVPLTVEKVLIGKPVSNTQIYILDQDNNCKPIGVSGELCIGGIQVSRGYLNKEELTKEKFVNNPFREGELMYRTGDLAKWTPDGNVEYIGRIDNQVKIRGYRIELGEIETVIQEFDQIQMTAVLVKPGYNGHLQLVAFVVAKEKIVIEKLKDFLKDRLPAYMIPNSIIECESFPVTSTGKLDRKNLLNLFETEKVAYEAPQTDNEKKIAQIWGELLNVNEVGVNDDFFLIGGDSILLIRMLTQLKKHFKKEIDLQKVYECSVLKDLVKLIESQDQDIKINDDIKKDKIKQFDDLKDKAISKMANAESIEDVYPMSDIQKGMVYEYYKNQEESVYHDQFVYLIPSIEPDVFNEAFSLLIKKHETLRTSFDVTVFEGIQIVNKEVEFTIAETDIQHLDKKQQEEYVKTFLAEQRKVKFNITKAPLWRADLIRISKTDMVYSFQFHHAILDGWSLASLNTELFDLYFKLIKNQEITIDALKTNNKLSIIESQIAKENKEYSTFWENYLGQSEKKNIFSEERTDDLYHDYFEGLDTKELERVAKECNTTIKTIFLGSYLYTLSLLSYEKDITIGLVSNNRPMSDDGDKLLGCFLNTVPFRMKVEKSWTWKDYILKLQENLNALKGRDRLSLYQINKIVSKNTSLDNPFFDSIFNYVNFHIYENLNYEDNSAQKSENSTEDNRFELNSFENVNTHLNFTLSTTGGKIRGTFKLKRKFKSGISVQDFVANFKNVLNLITNKPNIKVSNFDVLLQDIKNKPVYEWHNSQINLPKENSLFEKFENQVLQTPDQVAVIYNEKNSTYNDLNQEANQLAHYLKEQYDIKQGDVIGIKLERDENLVMVILGILKSGAAYVPLDINYPEDRIKYIENDSKCRLIITEKELNQFKNLKDTFPTQNPSVQLSGNNLAYIIYTSGTTGNPKGVMITHHNAMDLVNWAEAEFSNSKFEVVFASTSHCFDLSVFEMFYTLSIGKKIRILKDSLQIGNYLNEENILLNTVPSSVRTILDQGLELKNVNVINLAGEAFPSDIAQKLSAYDLEVRNLYGPTEDTTYSTCYKLSSDQLYKNVPIGKPLKNSSAFILDENLQILPAGVEGYLYLSGPGLSLGYRNNQKLTDEKFISNPNFDGLRMYNTGDIARWLPDGNLEYLGRKDNQVKLKGYRIELEEIENAILKFTDLIKQVVVTVKEDKNAQSLVAYMTGTEAIEKAELRHFLQSKIPSYMIPSYFIALEKIPLTPNGKTDLKALPDIENTDVIKNDYVAPRTDLEEKIVAIWEELLGIDKIGIRDNFFELGGDSLLVLRGISTVQSQLNINVSADIYFTLSTIEDLAAYIQSILVLDVAAEVQEFDVYDL